MPRDMHPATGDSWRDANGLLTVAEVAALEQCGALAGMLGSIVGLGPTRGADLAELYGHVHGIQQAIMSQAAARVYPERFRLLGEVKAAPAAVIPYGG